MYMLNNNKPYIEHCGTPQKMSSKLLYEPFTFVLCFLFARQGTKKYAKFVSTPYSLIFRLTTNDRVAVAVLKSKI